MLNFIENIIWAIFSIGKKEEPAPLTRVQKFQNKVIDKIVNLMDNYPEKWNHTVNIDEEQTSLTYAPDSDSGLIFEVVESFETYDVYNSGYPLVKSVFMAKVNIPYDETEGGCVHREFGVYGDNFHKLKQSFNNVVEFKTNKEMDRIENIIDNHEVDNN